MNEILNIVELAKKDLRQILLEIQADGGLKKDQYIRFLTLQHFLNKGVQKHFFAVAASEACSRKKNLRKWLLAFGAEEEFHYEIAKADLAELGTVPLECPLDVKLWWLFFDSVIEKTPFVRIGATCVLENVLGGSVDIVDSFVKSSAFLNPKNLRYLVIHKHGPNLNHGEQVFEALTEAKLTESEQQHLVEGAKIAAIFYSRFARWVKSGDDHQKPPTPAIAS